MARISIHADPGPSQAGRIRTVRRVAAEAGHDVRKINSAGKEGGPVVLVIKGPLSGLEMKRRYRSLDYLGLLDERGGDNVSRIIAARSN